MINKILILHSHRDNSRRTTVLMVTVVHSSRVTLRLSTFLRQRCSTYKIGEGGLLTTGIKKSESGKCLDEFAGTGLGEYICLNSEVLRRF